jgi:outer membrane protein assembly factor BamA
LGGGVNLFDSDDVDFYSAEFDFRRYWHYGNLYSLAVRVTGGASLGRTPKTYFLGGTTNWIGNTTLDAKVYEVENLYFADVVTPLRGVDYYSLSGDRYGLINLEFRYPMIDYFIMRFPLAIAISRVGGAIFLDMGAAWEGSEFKGGTSEGGSRLVDIKTGFGFGMRANLGFILLRYDMAWSTDFYNVSDKPSYYFSMGADF